MRLLPSGEQPADETNLFDRPGPRELPQRERRHRYLIERPGSAAAAPTDATGSAPAASPRSPTGNTQPLPVRPPAIPEPHPAAPTGRDPSGPARPGAASGDLGLRPESVARLSASGRELLARLQAELQGASGSPRAGGLSPNGGGDGTAPQAAVDPPDLAG